jgi:hypothetical protein
MKVKDLIERLKQFNPELEAVVGVDCENVEPGFDIKSGYYCEGFFVGPESHEENLDENYEEDNWVENAVLLGFE